MDHSTAGAYSSNIQGIIINFYYELFFIIINFFGKKFFSFFFLDLYFLNFLNYLKLLEKFYEKDIELDEVFCIIFRVVQKFRIFWKNIIFGTLY